VNYDFKRLPEVGWAMLAGAVYFGLQLLSEFDPEAVIADPKVWLIAAGGGLARAMGVAGRKAFDAAVIAIRSRLAG